MSLLCTTACPNTKQVDCNDLISVIIQAILNLSQQNGSDAASILVACESICTFVPPLTLFEIQTVLQYCARRGILIPVYTNLTSTPTYMINGNMTGRNVQNAKYNRPPCQKINGFWKPAPTTFSSWHSTSFFPLQIDVVQWRNNKNEITTVITTTWFQMHAHTHRCTMTINIPHPQARWNSG